MADDEDTPVDSEQLAAIWHEGQQALAAAGLTASDFLDELPAARAEVMREAYGNEFLRELEELRIRLLESDEPDE